MTQDISVVRLIITNAPNGYDVKLVACRAPAGLETPPCTEGTWSTVAELEANKTYKKIDKHKQYLRKFQERFQKGTDYKPDRELEQSEAVLETIEEFRAVLVEQAGKLAEVFWEADVWGEENAEGLRGWWKNVVRSSDCLIIELALCADIQRYNWETIYLLGKKSPFSGCYEKISIIRIRPEDVSAAHRLCGTNESKWLIQYVRHDNLEDFIEQISAVTGTRRRWFSEVGRLSTTNGDLDSLKATLVDAPSTGLLMLITHGEAGVLSFKEGSGKFQASPISDFTEHLPHRQIDILFLLVCDLGKLDQEDLDLLLLKAGVVIAMQTTISTKAARAFVDAFLTGPSDRADYYSLECLAVQTTKGRVAIRDLKLPWEIEMATPIVYSRIVTHPCPCLPATPGISSIASTPSPTLQDSTPISSTPSPTLQDSAPISSTSSPTLEDSAPPSSTPSPTLTPPLPLETTTTVTVPGRPTWASWKYVLSIAAVLIAVVVVAVFLLPGMFDKQQAPIIALPPPTIPVTGPTPTTPTMIVGDDKVTLATVQPGQQVPCRTAIRGMYTPDVTDAIWPVIYVNGLYHPADTPQGSGKPAQKTNGTWESVVQFGDCTLSRGDRFELLIVIADRSANAAFENYLAETRKTQSFPGMLLPDGADIRLRVEVVRQ